MVAGVSVTGTEVREAAVLCSWEMWGCSTLVRVEW